MHSNTEGLLRCFQVLETMNKTSNKYPCLGLCVDISLQVLGVNTKKYNCWITWEIMLTLVHESRQIGSGQTRDGKSERQHSRNQRTEMDWNG